MIAATFSLSAGHVVLKSSSGLISAVQPLELPVYRVVSYVVLAHRDPVYKAVSNVVFAHRGHNVQH